MDTFKLSNQVRLGISEALLLLYRYLTDIYALGDLSFVQFLGGYIRGRKRSLDGCRILTVSGNGIGELEKLLCLQWKFDYLETMAVRPAQMRLMRFLMDATLWHFMVVWVCFVTSQVWLRPFSMYSTVLIVVTCFFRRFPAFTGSMHHAIKHNATAIQTIFMFCLYR